MKTIALAQTVATCLFAQLSFAGIGHNETESSGPESPLNITIVDYQHPSCQGAADGYVVVRAEGGLGPYEYNWNTFPNQYREKATDLSAGVYFVHITDANGNKFYRSIELQERSKIDALNLSDTDYSTSSAEKAVEHIQMISAGHCVLHLNGVLIHSFDADQVEVGIHRIEITDATGCVTRRNFMVYENERPEAVKAPAHIQLAVNHALILAK